MILSIVAPLIGQLPGIRASLHQHDDRQTSSAAPPRDFNLLSVKETDSSWTCSCGWLPWTHLALEYHGRVLVCIVHWMHHPEIADICAAHDVMTLQLQIAIEHAVDVAVYSNHGLVCFALCRRQIYLTAELSYAWCQLPITSTLHWNTCIREASIWD
jgi:hypothetical protein